MAKKRFSILSMMVLTLSLVVAGCSTPSNSNEKIADIAANEQQEYQKAIEQTGLGILFDFQLKLPSADQSWVTMWVEAYKEGVKQPDHLTEISYGLSPNKVEEGHTGFGIVNPDSEQPLLYMYAPSVKSPPHSIADDTIFSEQAIIKSWAYTIDQKSTGLEPGETKVLAIYVQGENDLKNYDYKQADSIQSVIDDGHTVLLLKIKVEAKQIE
ncbi:hypothetical protein [Paenibacillus senegalimassiliensis]|uniref:hypothetical protein n=1 Tax=Paenibacillus senegalimassiliensis TaxID=1737426 RepID=UPI00073E6DEA|nr:hypothetical protein [Paenibacillus senegalimassiliensis]